MYKRLSVLFLMMAIIVVGTYAKDVAEADGTFWNSCSDIQKSSIVYGYLLACTSVRDIMNTANEYLKGEKDESKDILSQFMVGMSDWTSFDETVGQIVQRVNAFYSIRSNEKSQIYKVIPYLYDKGWWDTSSTPSTSSPSGA